MLVDGWMTSRDGVVETRTILIEAGLGWNWRLTVDLLDDAIL
jgi:hypothetical protein